MISGELAQASPPEVGDLGQVAREVCAGASVEGSKSGAVGGSRTAPETERRHRCRHLPGTRSDKRGIPLRYGGLHAVTLVDVSEFGVCIESDRVFRFGSGRLTAGARVTSRSVASTPVAAPRTKLLVRLVWSRLVKTERGPFGETCPTFRHGLEVEEASRIEWGALLGEGLRHGAQCGPARLLQEGLQEGLQGGVGSHSGAGPSVSPGGSLDGSCEVERS